MALLASSVNIVIFSDFSRKLMLTNFIFILGVIQIIDMDLEKATVFYKFSTFL